VCRVNADAITTNDDPACRPLNILGQGQFTPEAKAYSYGTSYQNTRFNQHVAAVNLQGDLVDLWAGPLTVATGLEYRRDSLSTVVDPISASNGFYVFNSQNASGRVAVHEGYAEAALPLLVDSPFARRLELNGAVRRAYYTDTVRDGSQSKFDATTWKIGAVYQPLDGVLLRVTNSQDIRAPNATELFSAAVAGQQVINDIRTANQSFARTLTGGNVRLQPEKAKTFTAGLTLSPPREWIGNARLSVDYYDIKVRGAIDTLLPQVIVDRCNLTNAPDLCGLVQRNASGLIDTVSVVYLNLNRVRARGIDIEASYRVPLADSDNAIDLRLLATKTLEFSTIDSTGSKIDRAGDNSARGVPSWVIDGLFTLALKPATISIQGHYISRGKVDATYVGPEDAGYVPTSAFSINTNRVPSRFYTNFSVAIDVIKRDKQSLQLFGAINNLFNVNPPARFNGNANAIYYDVLGRAFRMGVRVKY
jgi:outer membrane receptor protein involved in Fe transport